MKKMFSIYDCKEGNILASAVYNKYGSLILNENTVLNESYITKLIEMGIEYIFVYDENMNEDEEYFEILYEKYQMEISILKQTLLDLAKGKKISVETLSSLGNSIYSEINNSDNIAAFLQKIKQSDEYTFSHSLNVAFYSMLISKWMGKSEQETKNSIAAGLLHDIGKIEIPKSILMKPRKLTPLEYETIKKHPVIGYNILKDLKTLDPEILQAVLMHHEREDGSGYPFGIDGDKITDCSKIISIADVFDAMTSERIYKKKLTPFEAFKSFKNELLGLFDIRTVNIFLSNLSNYYTGAKVILNSGKTAEIIYTPHHCLYTPIVKVDSTFVDLSKNNNLKILEII